MNTKQTKLSPDLQPHSWLKLINVTFVPGKDQAPLTRWFVENLLSSFENLGHQVQSSPGKNTDILITTATYGKPITWRESLSLTARLRYKLERAPAIYTVLQVEPEELAQKLAYFQQILEKEPPDPQDYQFPGLSSNAYQVLHEQGKRGGAILAFERLVQAQAMCLHILLLVGHEQPEAVYHFDLVGGYPKTIFNDQQSFYQEIALRLVTCVSTHEITRHQVVDPPIPLTTWRGLDTPTSMLSASQHLDRHKFFTDMVRISDLVSVPSVTDAVASQYSEGCFATWDPHLDALIATITGSARPVDKGYITEDELAVLTSIRPDGEGALIRHVKGKRNDAPSSEAVELLAMDRKLPRIQLGAEWGVKASVPVIRSKLHGHRGVSSFNPTRVEFVPLDKAYYHYPVTCATQAQADAIASAFTRSEALHNPNDPRQLVFTILPTHGVMIAEKWVLGKAPFQLIWETFEAGDLVIDVRVPQGEVHWQEQAGNQVVVK